MILTYNYGIGFRVAVPEELKGDDMWEKLDDITVDLGVWLVETNKGVCYILKEETDIANVKSQYFALYSALEERGFNPVMPDKLTIGNMLVGGAFLDEDEDNGV